MMRDVILSEPSGRHAPRNRSVSASAFTSDEVRQASRLAIVLALTAIFFVLELIGAIAAGSLVLQAEAAHLFTDVLALTGSLLAMKMAVRRPTLRFTYGLRRVEPIAAVLSAGLVVLTTMGIVAEGLAALRTHTTPRAGIMLLVACGALAVHGVSAVLLHGALTSDGVHPHNHHEGHSHGEIHVDHAQRAHVAPAGHSLNLRGARLHVAGDALGALAALVAAIILHFFKTALADPVGAFAVAAILIVGAIGLLRDAVLVLLEAAPARLPVSAIRDLVGRFPGVVDVHELHVWTLGAGHDALTVHVCSAGHDPSVARKLSEYLQAALGIEYVTVQVDPPGRDPEKERLAVSLP
jgi:cobalt-zinc-cadmium efflux system protein